MRRTVALTVSLLAATLLVAQAAPAEVAPIVAERGFYIEPGSDATDDGRVVSYSHGCGAHSQVAVPTQRPLQRPVLVYETEADLPF